MRSRLIRIRKRTNASIVKIAFARTNQCCVMVLPIDGRAKAMNIVRFVDRRTRSTMIALVFCRKRSSSGTVLCRLETELGCSHLTISFALLAKQHRTKKIVVTHRRNDVFLAFSLICSTDSMSHKYNEKRVESLIILAAVLHDACLSQTTQIR